MTGLFRLSMLVVISLVLCQAVGCTRARYRRNADLDSYSILDEKTIGLPWNLPNRFSIAPDPRSRFAQLGPLDDPMLPTPAPRLYDYQLPPGFGTVNGNPDNNTADGDYEEISFSTSTAMSSNPSSTGPKATATLGIPKDILHSGNGNIELGLPQQPAGFQEFASTRRRAASHAPAETEQVNSILSPSPNQKSFATRQVSGEMPEGSERLEFESKDDFGVVRAAVFPVQPPFGQEGSSRQRLQNDNELPLGSQQDEEDTVEDEPEIVPIPQETWNNLPVNVLERMFEFETIREEYRDSFGEYPSDSQRDQSPRLALEDIIELALINSREYQAQKEQLYRVALRLTQERFNYELNFAPTGHSTSANYFHNRNGGETVNNLNVPTNVTGGKAMNIGGDLLARFANDVVLTFNGPTGFTADVGSDLFLNLSYAVLQRDVQFESLTQSERDVVYAARDFARFRRSFFVNLATQYYSLIQTYRSIDILSQNYLSLVRAFIEADAEFRATGGRPRIEVDQVEQNALQGRSALISTTNTLARSLDSLKLSLGIPPETLINLDLTELEELTRRDEATVTGELVSRSRRVLEIERSREFPDRAELINGSLNLVQRMLESIEKRPNADRFDELQSELILLVKRLTVEESRLIVRLNREELASALSAEPVPLLKRFERTMDLNESLLELIENQIALRKSIEFDQDGLAELLRQRELQAANARAIRDKLDRSNLPENVTAAEALLATVEELLTATERITEYQPLTREQEQARTIERVDWLLESSVVLEDTSESGLIPVEIQMDDAMLTALVQRFDLLNQRGDLADSWRQIKLAGDDLRSVLNLNAAQTVRTRPDVNRGFDFTWDESTTNLSLRFDTPLNRRSQRNTYRSALINYQLALRALMELEDRVKADVRDDLRNLQVRREQYRISVQSAALAYERVVSTQLQLQLGIAGVAARDFLEAQTDYAGSLNSVASDHIDYILLRTQLFLDMESLVLNEQGFWPDLYQEGEQPQPAFQFDPRVGSAYGELPPRLRYSRSIRRMNSIPNGQPVIDMPIEDRSEDLPGVDAATPNDETSNSGTSGANAIGDQSQRELHD